MNNRISVFLQDSNNFVSFLKATKIVVYEKSDVWRAINTISLPSVYSATPSILRKEISSIISQLIDCKIIAGLELTGIPFCVFDSYGFDIFSITEMNSDVLDGIIEDINLSYIELSLKNEIINKTSPVETSIDGIYYLDLVMLQTKYPEISSKKALKDFLNNTPFIELQLLCNHIPPWIENSLYDISSAKTSDDRILATIRKKLCKEGF